MKISAKITLLFILAASLGYTKNSIQEFDKSTFYSVMKSGKINEVNEQLNLVSSSSIPEKNAYEGVLLMRKAGLVKLPVERLKLFKKGRIELETALLKDPENGEYHFLRLTIEEHAPKIVKYSKDLATDKLYIKQSFKNLHKAVREAITDYSEHSKILSPDDFNQR